MTLSSKILVVDDEHSVRWAFEKALKKAGYDVFLAETGARGLAIFEQVHPDLTLLDIRMPEMDGLQVLKKIRESHPDAQVIVMTAYTDMETTVSAMKLGAYDFLSKPFNIDECLLLIGRGLNARTIKAAALPETDPAKTGGLKGNSPPMQEVYKLIGKVSAEDVTVLVTGESGSGKELVAQAIHYNSNRASKPFWAINCTAITESLMEAELFGYEKGAFTGANTSKPGVFELAQGGTLFLDEIGDMSLEMQAQLLRVLEERQIVRVGGNKRIKVDVRIIAATNKDLRKAIQESRFREDLYHRVKVIEIHLPPLRSRPEDIPLLASYFCSQLAAQRKGLPKSISDEALAVLTAHAWPGNVRELRNAIEQSYTLSRDQIILAEHLPIEVRQGVGSAAALHVAPPAIAPAPVGSQAPAAPVAPAEPLAPAAPHAGVVIGGVAPAETVEQHIRNFVTQCLRENIAGCAHDRLMDAVERELLLQALGMFKANQVQTANYLGITRNTLRAKIEKYGL
ncbi:MAG TPA: sigma-54 dependent transcriptional regulator [Candidatus Ozemobacteraceae bacterium]|nr:sigma-54 dependent transcriptional regulator [Candidatus Ozemobacteraceae bacterium]